MLHLDLNHLVEYTEWERQKWHDWLQHNGDNVLKISAGPHGDERFQTMGDLVRHIFSAEERYVERLTGRPVTDPASFPSDKIEALFQFGQRTRKDLLALIDSFPEGKWDVPNEYKILIYAITATPRKIVTHVLLHEIRHWAQIATLFRLNGLIDQGDDFLVSPVWAAKLDVSRPRCNQPPISTPRLTDSTDGHPHISFFSISLCKNNKKIVSGVSAERTKISETASIRRNNRGCIRRDRPSLWN